MNKELLKKIGLILAIIITCIIFFIFKDQINSNFENNVNLSDEINTETQNIEETNTGEEVNTQDKISMLRKRLFVKGLVEAGDNYYETNSPLLALNEYLKAYGTNDSDPLLISKIANTYYKLFAYSKTLEYFDKIKTDLSGEDLETYILSNFYNLDKNDKASYDLVYDNLSSLSQISQEDKFYYTTTLSCLVDFHQCKKDFQNYIESHEELSSKIKNIDNAIKNYEAFKSENLYYKDSLIIAEIFKDKLYPISTFLGLTLLKSKPDYEPIILIIGKGYYEVGDISNAREYLEKYYKLEPSDKNIPYLLGNLSFRSRDYETSNLYYNAALNNGYDNKVEVKRKIVYNNYVIGNKKELFKSFDSLIEEENSDIDDYSLAIYNYIENSDLDTALEISKKGLQKFDESNGIEYIYGYLGWIYREKNDYEKALHYLNKGLTIDKNNALLTLNMGYLLFINEEYTKANIYFKKTISITKDGEFYNLAKKKISEIDSILKEKQESEENKK